MKPRSVDGVIAIGSNSTRMLISPSGRPLKIIDRGYALTRLFEGLNQQNTLSDESIERTTNAILQMYEDAHEKYTINRFWIFATSALRDAKNKEEITGKVAQLTGIKILIISGKEEAYYSFVGAGAGLKGKYGVIDIGGGSTEVAIGSDKTSPMTTSMQIGAMRLMKKYPAANLSTLRVMLEDIRSVLAKQKVASLEKVDHYVGVGGTFTTLRALYKKGTTTNRKQRFSKKQVYDRMKDLFALSPLLRDEYPNMPKGRGDITPYGLAILYVLMDYLRIPYIEIGNKGNLDGWLIAHQKPKKLFLK